jgi:ElaB/YqjD/DUF883 family membrane-anchored ribosome-binding protein
MTDTRTDSFSSKPLGGSHQTGGARAGATSSSGPDMNAAKSGDSSFAEEFAALKETVANLASSAASAGQTVANQMGNAASATLEAGTSAANYAGEQARTLANDLEAFARRNPLGAMGGALALGVFIGMLGRGRH